MKIYFATDHAGFEMKNKLLEFVKELGFEVEDCGAYEFNPDDDYPEFVKKAAQAVSEAPESSRAIVLGGSGQGEGIVVNKFLNVRSTVYYGGNLEIVKLSREHNDANVLSLGARFLSLNEAKEAIKLWLETQFSKEERHRRRVAKIEN
ncbi:MAG: RpiB/LacA/LacB family sugar-phosphate isomerase [Parcubacteria group bacterium]|jgi:ribose 5-phosphate isomerase B|nr:RpiB/LacA/LacB family sugar-phosphate isomerase [Parcubacteria group bacterium]